MGVAARDPTLPRQRHRQILKRKKRPTLSGGALLTAKPLAKIKFDQRRDADEINPDDHTIQDRASGRVPREAKRVGPRSTTRPPAGTSRPTSR